MKRLSIHLFVYALAILSVRVANAGELELMVTDRDSGKPVPVRMHLTDTRGRTIKPRGQVAGHDHIVLGGKSLLKLGTGNYLFEMDRGPEYRTVYGNFEINRGATDNKAVEMPRFVDMQSLGWYAGDLLVAQSEREIELLMLAEDLYATSLVGRTFLSVEEENNELTDKNVRPTDLTDKNVRPTGTRFDGNRFYNVRNMRDNRAGGELLFFGLNQPLPLDAAGKEHPTPLHFAHRAREQSPHVHIAAGNLAAWDLPVWLAHGVLDSVMLLDEHQQREAVIAHEAGGKPRDRTFYPGTIGNGRWQQDIYYHALNCGFRLPLSAGSGSGEVANHVGYNRVYVHCGEEEFSEARWWDSLRAGRTIVTNGPILIPKANGQLPGHVFPIDQGSELQIDIDLKLFLKDKVDYLEVVKNGEVVHEVRLDALAKNRGRLPPLTFRESGWFLVRAVTNHTASYRMATTGPYYVEAGYQRRISKSSAQFFVDWVFERARQLRLADPAKQAEVLDEHRQAKDFFEAMVEKANAD